METAEQFYNQADLASRSGIINVMKAYAEQVALETLNESIVDLDLRPLSAKRKQEIIFKILSTPITLP